LFWDDGESIDTIGLGLYHYGVFTFENVGFFNFVFRHVCALMQAIRILQDTLSQQIINNYPELMAPLKVDSLNFLGLHGRVPIGITGDVGPDYVLSYIQENDKLVVYGAQIPLSENFKITFVY
jgi:hypothetical protein